MPNGSWLLVMRPLQRQLLACGGAALAAGCGRAEMPSPSVPPAAAAEWLALRDSATVRPLDPGERACTTCIQIEIAAELGKGGDPEAFIEHAFRIYKDAKARYWLVQGSEIKLFDSRGEYLRKVGAPGSGPGEWRSPWVATDSNGRAQIVDASTGRATELDDRFNVASEAPLLGLQINAITPTGPGAFVVNAWAMASDMVEEPNHVIEHGRIVRSFGASRGQVQTPFTARRVVGGDGRGHLVMSKPYSLDIEAWTDRGERITGVRGQALNQRDVLPASYDFDRNPLPNEVRGLWLDSLARVWVLTWRVKDNWKERFEERTGRNGAKSIVPKPGGSPRDYRFSRIEVIDMAAARVIARLDVPQILSGFVGSGELWENPLPGAEVPTITIWRIRSFTPGTSMCAQVRC